MKHTRFFAGMNITNKTDSKVPLKGGFRGASVYERILNIDKPTFDRLESSGLLRPNAKRDLLIYEYYLEKAEEHGSMQAIFNASEKFFLSEDQTKRIIYKMKGQVLKQIDNK